ncbi:MAG TPA: hypothetical protein VLJ39_11685 [Tepidisphaeraceae bacterium]|nr:hypothetical protein [Tepidisphaeraceae bacterium]
MDNTVVAVFQTTERATDAKRELLDAGFAEGDIGITTQVSAPPSDSLFGKLRALLGGNRKFRQSVVLTLYSSPDRFAEAEAVLRKFEPCQLQPSS